MQIKEHAKIVTADGDDIGSVERVVIDPKTKEVSHLVIQGGLWSENRVLPIDFVESSTEDQVVVSSNVDLDDLPPYLETHYMPLDQEELGPDYFQGNYAPPFYWYPSWTTGRFAAPGFYGMYPPSYYAPYTGGTEENIPDNTIALDEGSDVYARDGQYVGVIDQVIVDPENDRATHFVISKGVLSKTKKLVPANWIDVVEENLVRLNVGSQVIEKLSEYKE